MHHRWMQVWQLKQVQHLLQLIHGINIVEIKQNQLKIIENITLKCSDIVEMSQNRPSQEIEGHVFNHFDQNLKSF